MPLKTIAVFIDFSPSTEARTHYAVSLAMRHSAHLIGIYIATQRDGDEISRAYVRGEAAMRNMIDRQKSSERERLDGVEREFDAGAGREDIKFEFRVVQLPNAKDESKLHSLNADLIIVGFPAPGGLPREGSAETMLLATGVPFLIISDFWDETIAERIVLGWNASRESRRAMTDSLGLLVAAKEVSVLVIDGDKNSRHGEDPGLDAALFLARHGVNVTGQQIPSGGTRTADVIMDFARTSKADLIVVSAYSQSRSREIAFGGVTRSLLENVSIPLLIAH